MAPAAPYRIWLHRLGMTRLCTLVLGGYFLFSLIIQHSLPEDQRLLHYPFQQWSYIGIFGFVTVIFAVAQEMRRPRVLVSQRSYWVDYGYFFLSGMICFTFFESFGYTKSLIPVFQPYYLDPLLQRIDSALHLGVSPTQWAMGWLPDAMLLAIDYLYLFVWATVMMVYFVWQLTAPPGEGRSLFISSFVMVWIVAGILFATLFSSVGPIYYHLFYQDAYSPLSAALVGHLEAVHRLNPLHHAIDARQMLLDFYHSSQLVNLNGISAMPSLHTAIAMLIALHSHHYARRLRCITYPFALMIFFGSFALGWHYAIDTYVSAALLWVIWRLNRNELRRTSIVV